MSGPTTGEIPIVRDALLSVFRMRRTRSYLTVAPSLIEWIKANVTPGGRVDDGNSGSKPTPRSHAPIPVNAAALDDADELYATLVYWSLHFADRLAVTPPAHVLRYWVRDEDCTGLPGWATPHVASRLTHDLAVWLIEREAVIEDLSTAEDWHEDMRVRFEELHARWRVAPAAEQKPRWCGLCKRFSFRIEWSADGREYWARCSSCGLEAHPVVFEAMREAM